MVTFLLRVVKAQNDGSRSAGVPYVRASVTDRRCSLEVLLVITRYSQLNGLSKSLIQST